VVLRDVFRLGVGFLPLVCLPELGVEGFLGTRLDRAAYVRLSRARCLWRFRHPQLASVYSQRPISAASRRQPTSKAKKRRVIFLPFAVWYSSL
jgi:hypothetical protein